ncbi:MAG: sulfide/dihydroorotate dehydrogenase-like FAD/NAD-binding protein [Acholeplasmataceae bacterium]|nr:sulfide/dihydroorotate dehydrogenase-like FAD/NAD-binding protein [Acholeplasmataceae bacterium]
MFEIIEKKILKPTVTLMKIKAPYIVKHAEPGQFVILRVEENGERIPMTITEANHKDETITIIYQVVGATTTLLNQLEVGDSLHDFAGPLGKATELEGLKKVAVIGGGVGCAIAYPVAKALHDKGSIVHSIIGFRSENLIFLNEEFKACSDQLHIMTDDGSNGNKGFVTDALKKLLENGETYDEVIAIGPLPMMKFVSLVTKPYGIKTIVSMNPVMIDGTGMCGGCRITVGGQMKFACVDGPEFDGHLVDFDEAIRRNQMYKEFEIKKHDEACRLLKEKPHGK